jgi:hypothetical protein
VIPIQTRIEGGGKVPVFAAGRFPVLRVGTMEVPLSGPSVTLPGSMFSTISSSPSVRVTVENLPETYELRSLTFGSTDLKVNALQLAMGSSAAVVTPAVVITLALRPVQAVGVRVSGRIAGDTTRAMYISGNPGAIYSDGTFDFVAVPPGRHTIVALEGVDVGRSLGATLVVGDRDLPNIELEEISVAPTDSTRPSVPLERGSRPPGSRSATASIRGRVLDGGTREPFNAGKVVINSNYAVTFTLNDDGGFEVPRLLPGKYVVDAIVFGIGITSRTVVVDEQDATVELTLSP